jgi:hypothetical protein
MLMLILAIASFLLFFVISVLLWVPSTLESQAIGRERVLTRAKPLALLSITEAFDPIFAVLWEAPIAALELIDSAGTPGIPVARLRPIYKGAAARFPEIYDGRSFLQWLQFLEETHLISWHGSNVLLTPDGRAFLQFRFVTDAIMEV